MLSAPGFERARRDDYDYIDLSTEMPEFGSDLIDNWNELFNN